MVHQSVKELILIKSPLRWNDANGLVRLLVDEATLSQRLETLEANLLNLCVRYLLLDEIGENSLFSPEQLGAELPQSHDLFDDNLDSSRYDATCTWDEWEEDMLCYDPSECGLGGLFAYASVYWVDHFSVATARSMPDIRIIEKLCQRGSKRLDNWLKQNCRPNCTFKPRWDADSELFDPLGVTALYGSRAMLDNMLITSQFEKEAYLDNSGLQAAHHIVVNHHSADLFRIKSLTDEIYESLADFSRTIRSYGFTSQVIGRVAAACSYHVGSSELSIQTIRFDDARAAAPCDQRSELTYSNAVTLTGLTPATTYYYKIVSTNSTVDHFFSPRVPGDKTPFALNAVIDLGVYGEDGYTIKMDMSKKDTIPSIPPALNHTTISRLATTINDYEFVVHPGDLAYADDWYLKSKNLLDGANAFEAILENFYGQLAPIAGRKPYMASPGSHEANCQEIPNLGGLCPSGQKNFTDFMNRFGRTMPTAFTSTSSASAAKVNANKAKVLANPPFWYSFEYGMTHVVMIDTETDFADAPDQPGGDAGLNAGPFGTAGQQLAFLEADLASVDRTVTPWVIVGGHRPWYTTSGGDACDSCQDAFEPLFYKYGVDLGIFGHVHNSQRFLPVVNNTADTAKLNNPKAPVYIVAGGSGNIEGLSSVGTKQSYNAFAYADDFSYAKVSFLNATNLQVDFIRSSTGEVLDTSNLYKAHAQQFVVQ
ncbi:hypothetical protein TruAng_000369 [Truncatella angustata]|nr:hypothetical protein TruAng_000369 [Truncatella angustata]